MSLFSGFLLVTYRSYILHPRKVLKFCSICQFNKVLALSRYIKIFWLYSFNIESINWEKKNQIVKT